MEGFDNLRVPPHSTEAEHSVLGGLLLDNSAWDRVGDVLDAGDFYVADHRTIFTAIASLITASKPADVITVHERLKASGSVEELGGMSYLNALAASIPSAANIRTYANIVRDRSLRRRLIGVADKLATDAFGHDTKVPVQELVDRTVTDLMELPSGGSEHEPQLLDDLLPGFVDHVTALYQGESDAQTTGLLGIDEMLDGGARGGDLIVIGARPSMGKTSLVLTICRHVARTAPVLMCTLEDMLLGQTRRLAAAAGGINLADLRNPKNAPDSMWAALTESVERLRGLKLYLDDEPSLTVNDVRRKIQQVKRRAGSIGLVVVDYLQLMDGEGDNRNQALGFVANRLRRFSKEFNVPIVLLSQLSREADKRPGAPQMSDLRDSGDIESAARIVALLYREWVRNKKADKHHAELHIVKQNDGPTGVVHLYFDGPRLQYHDWDVSIHGPLPSTFGAPSSGGHAGLSA